MDEEIAIINENTRNEKIKNFFIKNKKFLLITILSITIIILGYFSYQAYEDSNKERISDKYNSAVIEYNNDKKAKVISLLKEVVEDKDTTYSPLALYFLIDNNLIQDKNEINALFDILINKTSLDEEIKNLIIYKKGLFNADQSDEIELLEILKPLINSESIWTSHALNLTAEYFYSKNEKQKSKEFFKKILTLKNANKDIVQEAQKRLNRDLSD
tara:strand:+ start:222 stop:866 length:645 start_codon:yes stop_codon:yes gene_type:complete